LAALRAFFVVVEFSNCSFLKFDFRSVESFHSLIKWLNDGMEHKRNKTIVILKYLLII